MARTQYQEAADAIIDDMTGRSGGDHWFESCDEEVQQEIREAWAEILEKHFPDSGPV